MFLFINNKAFMGNPVHTEFEKDRTRLYITDLSEHNHMIVFEIPLVWEQSRHFSGHVKLAVSELKVNENKYIFEEDNDFSDNSIYALLCPDVPYPRPTEIYILAENRDNIEVLKQTDYQGSTMYNEKFLNHMYFVKIHMKEEDIIPIYFANKNAGGLREGIEICSFSGVPTAFGVSGVPGVLRTRRVSTYIRLDERNCNKYIPLSEL